MVSFWQNGNRSSLAMWSLSERQLLWKQSQTGKTIYPLAFSPDGRTLAVSVDESTGGFRRPNFAIDFVDTATGKRRHFMEIPSKTRLQDAAFLSDRELVVATSEDVSIVDTQAGAVRRRWRLKLPAPPNQQSFAPGEIRISADGTTVLASSERTSNTVVAIYDARTGKQRGKWFCPGISRSPRLSPDGTLWAMNPQFADVPDFYDAQTGKKLWSPSFIVSARSPWNWSADGRQVVVSLGSNVNLLDARTGGHLKQVGTNSLSQDLTLSPDGDYFYTLDDKGKIWRWRAR